MLYTITPLPVSLGMQLSMSRVDLELIPDVDMYHLIEYPRRDLNDPPAVMNQNLIYLDVNNLYRWAMSQPFPTHGFHFLQPNEIDALGDVQQLADDAENGYIFEVDLSYPHHLHDSHDYPLAP